MSLSRSFSLLRAVTMAVSPLIREAASTPDCKVKKHPGTSPLNCFKVHLGGEKPCRGHVPHGTLN